MSLTRAEADQIAQEAIAEGWEGDRHVVDLDGHEYNEGYGRVTVHDWDEIDRARAELGNASLGGSGCTVELHWPDLMGPKYWINEREDWRKLKAKVEEIREIVRQMAERGWQISAYTHLCKAGKLGMMIEVSPPGYLTPVRVGGMRTWRKLCREVDGTIQAREKKGAIESGATE